MDLSVHSLPALLDFLKNPTMLTTPCRQKRLMICAEFSPRTSRSQSENPGSISITWTAHTLMNGFMHASWPLCCTTHGFIPCLQRVWPHGTKCLIMLLYATSSKTHLRHGWHAETNISGRHNIQYSRCFCLNPACTPSTTGLPASSRPPPVFWCQNHPSSQSLRQKVRWMLRSISITSCQKACRGLLENDPSPDFM